MVCSDKQAKRVWWESEAAAERLEHVLREINSARLGGDRAHLVGANDRGGEVRSDGLTAAHQELVEFAETRLAAYGTLRPGESNHGQLAAVRGEWLDGVVDGVRFEARGYPAFLWRPGNGQVSVSVLTSAALPEHWPRLDEFEGPDYRRIVIPVRRPTAKILVANLYAYIGPQPQG